MFGKTRLIAAAFVVAFLFLITSLAHAKIAQAEFNENYDSIVKKVENFDSTADFTDLRVAYTKTSDYNPLESMTQDRKAMYEAYEKEDFQKVLSLSDEILKKNFVDIETHIFALIANQKLGKQEKADYHRYVLKGLLKSLFASADGKTPNTAFKVINAKEAYIILKLLGLEPQDGKVLVKGGHTYNVLKVVDIKSGKSKNVYFNVDIPDSWRAKNRA